MDRTFWNVLCVVEKFTAPQMKHVVIFVSCHGPPPFVQGLRVCPRCLQFILQFIYVSVQDVQDTLAAVEHVPEDEDGREKKPKKKSRKRRLQELMALPTHAPLSVMAYLRSCACPERFCGFEAF